MNQPYMTEIKLTPPRERLTAADIETVGEVHPSNRNEQKLITLQGITTSQIRKRERLSDTPAYCFLCLAKIDCKPKNPFCQICCLINRQIPTIFRTSESYQQIKTKIKKGSYLQVEGYFLALDKSRPSFTVYNYQVLNQPNYDYGQK